MLVVIGTLGAVVTPRGARATGAASDIAKAAAAAGGSIQIVGRVGDDPTGDALLADLAAAGVGHVAVLRAGGETTPMAPDAADDEAAESDREPAAEAGLAEDVPAEADPPADPGLALDAADLELALRYLPDYRVIVAAPGLDRAALATVVEAAEWSGARLVVLVERGGAAADLPADATILEAPRYQDSTFAALVGRYAVELDRGRDPGDAFAAASTGGGWQPVEG